VKKILVLLGLLFILTGCTKSYEDGREYEGDLNIFFKPHGEGLMTYPDGAEYEGEFTKGEVTGEGVYRFNSGMVHSGQFENAELKEGVIRIKIDGLGLNIKVENFEPLIDEDQNLFVVNEHEDISKALAHAMVTGETIFVNSKNFDFDTNTLRNSKYGIFPYMDIATNYAINEFGIYNPSFKAPVIKESFDFPFIKSITIDFSLSKVQRTLIDETVKKIASEVVTDEMNDFEKVLSIHDYLRDRIDYNYDIDNLTDIDHTAYGALLKGLAVCDGYMDAFHLILHEVGIESYNVSGDDLNDEDQWWHAWNLVKMGEEFYHIDLTWNDDKKDRHNYKYFGLTDEEISETHVIFEANKIPEAKGEQYNYYRYQHDNGNSVVYHYNNATYYGHMNASAKEHGYGKLYFFDGAKYIGNFNNGNFTTGTYYYDNGARFEGTYVKGKRSEGKLMFPNGDRFEGNFKSGEMSYGTYYFRSGDRFEGEVTPTGFGYGTYYWRSGQSKTADFSQ